MNDGKLVSVIMPSYKRCESVTRAIDSVLAQTYTNIEVCLVDDNNPGDEYSLRLQRALIKYANDCRVRYISQEKHINGAVARNVGIQAAKGDYIGFLDDDDEWMPEKTEASMRELEENPDIEAVTVLWKLYKNDEEIRKCAPYTSVDLQFKVLLREVAVYTSTVLIKKTAIERFGGFDCKLLRHQDLQFLVKALAHSRFGVVPEYLVKLHADSEINKPDVGKLICTKKAFFESVKLEYNQYDCAERKRIMNAHYYEIVLAALREKKFTIATEYLLKAGFSIQSIKDLIQRYKERRGFICQR